jgi:hypothetical protein
LVENAFEENDDSNDEWEDKGYYQRNGTQLVRPRGLVSMLLMMSRDYSHWERREDVGRSPDSSTILNTSKDLLQMFLLVIGVQHSFANSMVNSAKE